MYIPHETKPFVTQSVGKGIFQLTVGISGVYFTSLSSRSFNRGSCTVPDCDQLR
jgi:hypothetical protein